MESFLNPSAFPRKIRLAVLNDVDINSASLFAEKYVPQTPQFDAIVVAGPFASSSSSSSSSSLTLEQIAVAQGDMASIIAQLENVVCRVIYLPAEEDPPATLLKQLHLTPNSVNIYARRMNLRGNLFISVSLFILCTLNHNMINHC